MTHLDPSRASLRGAVQLQAHRGQSDVNLEQEEKTNLTLGLTMNGGSTITRTQHSQDEEEYKL